MIDCTAMSKLRFAVLALAIACVPSNDITVRTSAIDDRSPSDTGDDYDFQHVSYESNGLQKPGFFAVHDGSSWNSLFTPTAKGDLPPLPNGLDLKGHMLFVATSKTPGAKAIEVQKITRTFDGLHIYVLETIPAESCPAEPRKGPPMDIVALDNVQLDLHVVYDRVHAETCGPPPDAVIACRVAGSGSQGGSKVAASPGDTIDCDSSQSRPQVGSIIDRRWQLLGLPPGSNSKLALGKGNIGITFPSDAWGSYQVELVVRDATRDGSGEATVDVLPPEAGVELFFTRAAGLAPAALPHVELHVLELPAGIGSSGDCSPQSQRSWCDVRTQGPLQLGAFSPEAKKRYRVMVKYLDARLPGSPGVCVRAFAKGVPAASACEAEDAQRTKGAVWDVGALDLAHLAFYDARLSKPPVVAATATTTTTTAPPPPVIPPPPPPPPPAIPPPPPTATPSATSTSKVDVEL